MKYISVDMLINNVIIFHFYTHAYTHHVHVIIYIYISFEMLDQKALEDTHY